MGIIYVISVLLLVSVFMLMKKTEKTLEVLSFLGISIVLTFSYNMFLCYILTFACIPITLLSLTIANVLISIPILYIILRKREIQKYRLDKFGIISIIVISIVTIIVGCLNFGIPFKIKYETTDPATHYLTAKIFSEEESLLTDYEDDAWGNFIGRKAGSYVNSGILMKCFSNYLTDEMDNISIFMIFGMFVLFLTGIIMYNTFEKYTKSLGGKILALIVSLLYVLGYPLNSFLFGFEYMSMAILVARNYITFYILF